MSGNKQFGALVRRLRQNKQKSDPSYSLRQFAEKVGLSPTFISKMETGDFDPPKAENIKKIAELLDYDADELLALANKIDPNLKDIINKKRSVSMADFLRTANGLSEEQLQKVTEQMNEIKRKDEA